MSEAERAVLRRRHVGVVFQFFNLISNMTVADNVELPALLAGDPKQARERREYLLDELGLSDRADTSPARCPAASSSASPWRGHSPTSPASCSPTSPPATSTAPTHVVSYACSSRYTTRVRRSFS